MSSVRPGDRLTWNGLLVEVRRVARDGSWADIRVTHGNGHVHTKRQPLPFPQGFGAVSDGSGV